MVRLTCLLRRKPGTTHQQFLEHWRGTHAPLIQRTNSGSHVLRYEQHPTSEADSAYDGVTMQWFASMDDYQAHMAEADFAEIWEDIETFLDVDHLEFILTDDPAVVIDRQAGDA